MDSQGPSPVSPRIQAPSPQLSFHNALDSTTVPALPDHSSTDCIGPSKMAVASKYEISRPLRLLDLPVDILRDIVKEVTHTNDLTSLALCHSALHCLTIPHIYSRFDIVWPDSTTHHETRSGVDALTYGLATLVMDEDIFDGLTSESDRAQKFCSHCGYPNLPILSLHPLPPANQRKRRRGNHYAKFTRKFSLGNGPSDWVQEYMITKEGGKMLGTLVALAVARMRNLETFIWDMPTGVLRDVWIALASHGQRDDGNFCRLERLWIRWHDNSQVEESTPPPQVPIAPMGSAGLFLPHGSNLVLPHGSNLVQHSANVRVPQHSNSLSQFDRVEHPTFSILPPMKSLSVLDIDELDYLDEMSVLIKHSIRRLRELRVGIARHAQSRDWVACWEGGGLQQSGTSTEPTSRSALGEKRLGGVLGVLVCKIYNIRQHVVENNPQVLNLSKISSPADETSMEDRLDQAGGIETEGLDNSNEIEHTHGDVESTDTNTSLPVPPKYTGPHFVEDLPPSDGVMVEQQFTELSKKSGRAQNPEKKDTHPSNERLTLQILELERVPLSVRTLRGALDWGMLTELTILDCSNHEHLWRTLRHHYMPGKRRSLVLSAGTSSSSAKASRPARSDSSEYHLKLKKIHTNMVSTALIIFLKEALAPNTLEVLFLQESRAFLSSVTIDAIYRGPLKRHRASLRKISIDSSEKNAERPTTNTRWRKWMLNREILDFITSGRMTNLRELGMAISYQDWHYFLRQLPFIPRLRSLYIPYLADYAHGNDIDAKELALQIVTIVHLRPEIELAYLGIATKCFEILETRATHDAADPHGIGADTEDGIAGAGPVAAPPTAPGSDDEDDPDADDVDADDADADGDGHDDDGDAAGGEEDEDTETEDDEDHGRNEESDADGESEFAGEDAKSNLRLRLREILFYDDKVAVFKARHGRL